MRSASGPSRGTQRSVLLVTPPGGGLCAQAKVQTRRLLHARFRRGGHAPKVANGRASRRTIGWNVYEKHGTLAAADAALELDGARS